MHHDPQVSYEGLHPLCVSVWEVCLSVHQPLSFSSLDRGVRPALSKAPHVLFGQAVVNFAPEVCFLSPTLMKSWNILFSC